jgi:hypothetical protein
VCNVEHGTWIGWHEKERSDGPWKVDARPYKLSSAPDHGAVHKTNASNGSKHVAGKDTKSFVRPYLVSNQLTGQHSLNVDNLSALAHPDTITPCNKIGSFLRFDR